MFGIAQESKVFGNVRELEKDVAGWVGLGELPPQAQCTLLLTFLFKTNCLIKQLLRHSLQLWTTWHGGCIIATTGGTMRTCFVVGLLLASAAAMPGFQGMPRCTAVEPELAKAGDAVSVTCENADKASVADLYLTDGKTDTKAAIMERTGSQIKFQVPKIKPGRYHLALLTANKASMIEQPVVLTVE
jgi:hypothetical protein